MADTYLNYAGTDLLWKKIVKLIDKKVKVVNSDDSIRVTDNNKIAVRISASEGNMLQLKPGEGLYVSDTSVKLKKLKFGADQVYEYDGTEEVTVPVYTGEIY